MFLSSRAWHNTALLREHGVRPGAMSTRTRTPTVPVVGPDWRSVAAALDDELHGVHVRMEEASAELLSVEAGYAEDLYAAQSAHAEEIDALAYAHAHELWGVTEQGKKLKVTFLAREERLLAAATTSLEESESFAAEAHASADRLRIRLGISAKALKKQKVAHKALSNTATTAKNKLARALYEQIPVVRVAHRNWLGQLLVRTARATCAPSSPRPKSC